MVKADIWVEGIADQKFLADVLSVWFGLAFQDSKMSGGVIYECRDETRQIEVRIRAAGTVSAFIAEKEWRKKEQDFVDNQSFGIKNLIIADADDDVAARKTEVAQTVQNVGFNPEFDLFLFPNHQESGDLENLLEQIIHPEHQAIFECWNAYEECLRKTPGKTYTTPARKTKIYAYLEALLGNSKKEKEKIKEREREYTNADHWQLDPTKEHLKPLHEFLTLHLGL